MSYLRDELMPLLKALKDLGGYIVIPDDEGEEFILGQRILDSQYSADDVDVDSLDDFTDGDVDEEDEIVELVNRDIALAQEEEALDDLGAEENTSDSFDGFDADTGDSLVDGPPSPPPLRVKFEPIRGDISPDLQE